MPDEQPLRILVLGDCDTPEMRLVAISLAGGISGGDIRHAADAQIAEDLVTGRHWFPDLVVVCQHWPDEFPESAVRRLLGLLPLARWVCCFGAWCEADGRNRDIWPPAIRIPARTTEARIRRELEVLKGEQPPLPFTASRDEIFEFDRPGTTFQCDAGLPVRVISPDRELRHWLQDLLAGSGYRLATARNGLSAQVIVWDCDPWNLELAANMRDFRRKNPGVAVIGLMNFAHPENVEAAQTCGADTVVAKLTTHTDLLAALAAARPG